MKVIYTVIIAVVVIFIITFSLENAQPVKLHYYDVEFFNQSLPTYMLIFIAFLAGVIFTGFMGVVERFRLNRTINRLNKTIRDLRREARPNGLPPYGEGGPKPPELPGEGML
jgi:uncharacterized integral membrane protein